MTDLCIIMSCMPPPPVPASKLKRKAEGSTTSPLLTLSPSSSSSFQPGISSPGSAHAGSAPAAAPSLFSLPPPDLPPSLPPRSIADADDGDDEDEWLCSQPAQKHQQLQHAALDFSEHDDCDNDDDHHDDEPWSDEEKDAADDPRGSPHAGDAMSDDDTAAPRRPFSLDYEDMPTLDAEDAIISWSGDAEPDSLQPDAAVSSSPPSSLERDVVDLTSDDEPNTIPFPSLPQRSASAFPAFASTSPSASHSTRHVSLAGPVRRNITDFFTARAAPVKHEGSEERKEPAAAGDAVLRARRASEGSAVLKREPAAAADGGLESWRYLLTGKQPTVKPASGRGRGRGGRGGRGRAAAASRGRGAPRFRYDRFTRTAVKDEQQRQQLPGSLFSGPTAEEQRTLEHIHRFTLATGFRSGPCPAFKRIAGTDFLVDGFQYSLSQPQCRSFFLSHHHSDHTVGLYRTWDVGVIYCSQITATLLIEQDGLSPAVVRPVPLHRRVFIDGAFVTLIDANHCPGAVIFVFELPPFADEAELMRRDAAGHRLTGHGPVFVHCGDFRYCREMGQLFRSGGKTEMETAADSATVEVPSAFNHYPSLYAASSLTHLSRLSISGVYLDTTYCKPVHLFPPQAAVVNYTLTVVQDVLMKEKKANDRLARSALNPSTLTGAWSALSSSLAPAAPVSSSSSSSCSPASSFLDGYSRAQRERTLFLVGSYSIGKEKIFLELARRFGFRIFASPAKLRLIQQIECFSERSSGAIVPDIAASQLMKDASAAFDSPPPAAAAATAAGCQSPAPQSSLSWTSWTAADVLTSDITASRLHVVPLSYCSLLGVADYIDPTVNPDMRRVQHLYHSVVCFRPTGWVGNQPRKTEAALEVNVIKDADGSDTKARKAGRQQQAAEARAAKKAAAGKQGKGKAAGKKQQATSSEAAVSATPSGRVKVLPKRGVRAVVHHVPYSEHSNYSELQAFVRLMIDCGLQQQDGIVPTVNVDSTAQIVNEFSQLFAERRKQQRAAAAIAGGV